MKTYGNTVKPSGAPAVHRMKPGSSLCFQVLRRLALPLASRPIASHTQRIPRKYPHFLLVPGIVRILQNSYFVLFYKYGMIGFSVRLLESYDTLESLLQVQKRCQASWFPPPWALFLAPFYAPTCSSSFASTLVILLWLSPNPRGYSISFKPCEFTSPGLRAGIGVPPCPLHLGLSDLSLNLLTPYTEQYSVLIAV